jgi:uncharacterized lipoprotein YmbA
MIGRFARIVAVLLVAGGALAGCASPDPRLNTLTAAPGAIRRAAPLRVAILAPTIPRYLDRLEIMTNVGDNRRQAADNDWWDEPLGQMIPRILAANLAQRLPQSTIWVDGAVVAAAPAAQVQLAVDRFDKVGDEVLLTGHLGVQFGTRAPMIDDVRVVVPVAGQGVAQGVAAQVAAMSVALGQVAERAAADLDQGR